MSFSSKVKEELIKIPVKSPSEKKAEIYSLIAFDKSHYENPYTIKRLSFITYGSPDQYHEKLNYSIYKDKNKKINVNFSFEELVSLIKNFVSNNQFISQILRGIFISCGSVTNPTSDYHLEFLVKDTSLLNLVISIMEKIDIINLKPKIIYRKLGSSIYIKDNSQITDFLTYIGATNSSMEFMQVKMMKEIRNYVNRTTNFETANITKTTFASTDQINAINHIINTIGLDALPETLKETAILRIQNPYMSLEELSKLFSKPITKSGVNYRLKKLLKYFDSL